MRRVPRWSIRKRLALLLAVPLISLAAIWAFAATTAVTDALSLMKAGIQNDRVGEPTGEVIRALQAERLDAAVFLGRPGAGEREAMTHSRETTNKAIANWRRQVNRGDVQDVLPAKAKAEIRNLDAQTKRLQRLRGRVDVRAVDAPTLNREYADVIAPSFDVFAALNPLDQGKLSGEALALTNVSHSRELLAQEDTLLSSALAAGRMTQVEIADFTQLVGARRLWMAEATDNLATPDRQAYERLTRTDTFVQLHTIEDAIGAEARAGRPAPAVAVSWRSTLDSVLRDLDGLTRTAGDRIITTAKPLAIKVFGRLAIVGVLGLIAVVMSIVMSVRMASTLIRRLTTLRHEAIQLASERLPNIVHRLQRGEEVDIAKESPPLEIGRDEIGQVGQAFNSVRRTAIVTAVEQAKLRAGVSNVFLNIARRSQALVHRQIKILDTMERRETDPDDLRDLFRADHLATRIRRNAENLVILGGAVPGRQWRKPMPLSDVLRGAASEVEEYVRIRVTGVPETLLRGVAFGDVMHLLAELMENAASFSPPHTEVSVTAQLVPKGVAIEIEDRGLGMSSEELDAANERLASPPEFSVLGLSDNTRLGMFVVSRLAARHGIRVSLRESPYGGTTAIVLLPPELIVQPRELAAGDADTGTHRTLEAVRGGSPAAIPTTRQSTVDAVPAGVDAGRPDERRAAPTPLPKRPLPQQRTAGDSTAHPAAQTASPVTPQGLPRRVRQASLAPQLRDEPAAPVSHETVTTRPAEEIRSMMASYQKASLRGREDGESTFGSHRPLRTANAETEDTPEEKG